MSPGRKLLLATLLAPRAIQAFLDLFNPDNWFRQVPEGMEFVGVLLTILGSLAIMVMFGAWWSR